MTVLKIIWDKMRVEYDEPIKLHSYRESNVKFDIDKLYHIDLALLVNALPNISNIKHVIGIGGGMRFAKLVAKKYNVNYTNWNPKTKEERSDMSYSLWNRGITEGIVIVDDVLTTGRTMESIELGLLSLYDIEPALGIVIVKRNDLGRNSLDFPVISLCEYWGSDEVEIEASLQDNKGSMVTIV